MTHFTSMDHKKLGYTAFLSAVAITALIALLTWLISGWLTSVQDAPVNSLREQGEEKTPQVPIYEGEGKG